MLVLVYRYFIFYQGRWGGDHPKQVHMYIQKRQSSTAQNTAEYKCYIQNIALKRKTERIVHSSVDSYPKLASTKCRSRMQLKHRSLPTLVKVTTNKHQEQ